MPQNLEVSFRKARRWWVSLFVALFCCQQWLHVDQKKSLTSLHHALQMFYMCLFESSVFVPVFMIIYVYFMIWYLYINIHIPWKINMSPFEKEISSCNHQFSRDRSVYSGVDVESLQLSIIYIYIYNDIFTSICTIYLTWSLVNLWWKCSDGHTQARWTRLSTLHSAGLGTFQAWCSGKPRVCYEITLVYISVVSVIVFWVMWVL